MKTTLILLVSLAALALSYAEDKPAEVPATSDKPVADAAKDKKDEKVESRGGFFGPGVGLGFGPGVGYGGGLVGAGYGAGVGAGYGGYGAGYGGYGAGYGGYGGGYGGLGYGGLGYGGLGYGGLGYGGLGYGGLGYGGAGYGGYGSGYYGAGRGYGQVPEALTVLATRRTVEDSRRLATPEALAEVTTEEAVTMAESLAELPAGYY
ncbi:keratin-associated protein 19-2 [Ixodes scapularis]